MKNVIVDTVVLALLSAGDRRVEARFAEVDDGAASAQVTSIGVAEFYHKTCRRWGKDAAEVFWRRLETKFRIVAPDFDLALGAGLAKCRDSGLSLADSFMVSLTDRLGGTLLTTESRLAKKVPAAKFFRV